MPKSRKRRPKKQSRQSARRDLRRATPEEKLGGLAPYIALTFDVDAAERRGDARGALDLIEQRLFGPDGELYWRPWRITRLSQMANFGPWLPRWATSRWLLEQALQDLPSSRHPGVAKAFATVAAVLGGLDGVRRPDGEDPHIKVMDHDWVFRQCLLYEYGGLASYLRRAAPDFVVGADHIHDWVRAPMGGFRYEARSPSTTTWVDLATDERVEIANIGSAAMLVEGEHAIGRMVPIESGRMFETMPLGVPEAVARAVAAAPTDWIDILKDARARGEEVETGGFRFGFLTDVRMEVAAITLYDDLDLLDKYEQRVDAFIDTVRRAFREQPTDDPEVIDVWACIAAEILNWNVFATLARKPRPGQEELFARLGKVLAEPAARFCRDLSVVAREAA